MTTDPQTAFVTAARLLLINDAGVKATAMGAAPRIVQRAAPGFVKPFIVMEMDAKPYVTQGAGAPPQDMEGEFRLYVEGDGEGDDEGRAIQFACKVALEAWAATSPSFSGHRLANLEFTFGNVGSAEGGKSYEGRQDWRVVTDQES